METANFRPMLTKLSATLTSDELEALKYMCIDSIPRSQLESISSPVQLWIALEERDLLNPQNTEFLRELLKSSTRGRTDALKILDQYEGSIQHTSSLPKDGHQNAEPDNIPDLHNELDLVTENLGRNWRNLARSLGLNEADIDCIAEDNIRNTREQIRQTLRLWQKKQRQGATRQALIDALQQSQFNQLACKLEKLGCQ